MLCWRAVKVVAIRLAATSALLVQQIWVRVPHPAASGEAEHIACWSMFSASQNAEHTGLVLQAAAGQVGGVKIAD
jgi:hypothetical protein